VCVLGVLSKYGCIMSESLACPGSSIRFIFKNTLTFTLILNMREIVRISQQGSCVCMYKYKIVYVCVYILYKGMHFEDFFLSQTCGSYKTVSV
jgi:hypothetical protein